ncbi:MAG: lipopolysaccharide heptosyltransferase I [Geobacter sp.]|nr:lipopolysaccharide heptosyltransferase I [Geobacter sp.]
MRILIIKTSSLGDIIHALPVLEYLRQAEPAASIDWVVDEAFADLVSGNPLLNRVLTVAFRRWKKAPFTRRTRQELVSFIKTLRQECYDLIFDLQGNLKSGMVCAFGRAPVKVGFSRAHQQERLNALFTNRKVGFLPPDRNAGQRYLRIVSAPFALPPESVVPHSNIYTSPEDDTHAQQMIGAAEGRPLILFHNGTTWTTKFWHAEGWKQLADALLLRYQQATILLSWGNKEEHALAEEIARHIGSRAVVLGKMSLKQFVAVLKRVDLVVGGDTGPVHLAAAVGTPTVSFYRSSDGTASGPQGSRHRIVQSPLACTRCFRTSCLRDDECRASITVEAMMSAVEKVLIAGAESSVKREEADSQVSVQ